MRDSVVTAPDNLDVIGRPRMAKMTTTDSTPASRLSEVVKEAAKVAHGKQGAAAAHLGKDEGNFARDLQARRMTIGQLEDLGVAFLAAFGKKLHDEYGPLASPDDQAERLLDQVQAIANELRQYVRLKRTA